MHIGHVSRMSAVNALLFPGGILEVEQNCKLTYGVSGRTLSLYEDAPLICLRSYDKTTNLYAWRRLTVAD